MLARKSDLIKKLIFLMLFSGLVKLSSAQEFLGIPVDGTGQEFVKKISDKGFEVTGTDIENVVELEGIYRNENVELLVLINPLSGKVWKLCVDFPEDDNWADLKSRYFKLKEEFTQEQGRPENVFEFFLKPYKDGDGREFKALKEEKCNFYSFWKNFSLEISSYGQVTISYENEINAPPDDKETKND